MEDNEKTKDDGLQKALEFTEKVINTAHDPVIILHDDLQVALANRAFYHLFGANSKETEGQFIYELGNRQWDIPKLRHLLEDILPKTTSFDNFEIEHDFPVIGRRKVLLNACRIYIKDNRTKLIIITIKDITERNKIVELTEKIRELEARLKKNLPPNFPA